MRYFQLQRDRTTIGRECLAGLVTFCTMSYILCVQPALLSGQMLGTPTGMDFGALITTTCLVSAAGCFLMGFLARYPFALAPGMGENFFLVLSVFPLCASCLGEEVGAAAVWQLGLGVVFFSGLLFLLLSLLRVRHFLMEIVSPPMKSAISVGIGLFIAYLGLKNGGLFTVEQNLPHLGVLWSWDVGIFTVGLLVSLFCMQRRIPGGILAGILCAAWIAVIVGKISVTSCFGLPADPRSVVGQMNLSGIWTFLPTLLPMIFILTFMDIFDTFGTVMGIAQQSNLLEKGSLPRAERVFASDALATILGAYCGHSTVTAFVESASGVESGGRTGLTAIVTGSCFLLALFCTPLIMAIGGYAPITASALVLVGLLMMRNVQQIPWQELDEAVPCFLLIVGIPFSNSIADGILLGLLAYPVVKVLCARRKDVPRGMVVLWTLLLAYTFWIR